MIDEGHSAIASHSEVKIEFPRLWSSIQSTVYVLHEPVDAHTMHNLASGSEYETAFLVKQTQNSRSTKRYYVRWFSQNGESQLCGTGAIAAVCTVGSKSLATKGSRITLESPGGLLVGKKMKDGHTAVRLPGQRFSTYEVGCKLRCALGLQRPVIEAVASEKLQLVLLHLPDERAVETLSPDWEALKSIQEEVLGAVIVAAEGTAPFDVTYRYFTPWYGKNESQVAGSALALIGPYWKEATEQDSFCAHQRSQLGASFYVQAGGPEGVWISVKTRIAN